MPEPNDALPREEYYGRSTNRLMRLLYFLADMFINTFGITQPTQKTRKRAAFFILGLIVLVLATATSAFFIIHSLM
jgi:hypothetical protein